MSQTPYQPFDLTGTLARQRGADFNPFPFAALNLSRIATGTLPLHLTPERVTNVVTFDAQGNPLVGGVPIASIGMTAQELAAIPPGSTYSSGTGATAVFDSGPYGDSAVIPVNFLAAGDQLALSRPANTRTMLLVQNNTLGVVTYNWDKQADPVSSVGIPAGGNRLWAAPGVPQGDLHIFSGGAGVVVVEYMNVNLKQ